MNRLWQDIRFAVRVLLKSPGFTLVAVLALALGIGINVGVFSGVNAFLLRPLPIERPDEVVAVISGSRRNAEEFIEFSYPDFIAYREQSKSFSGMVARNLTHVALSEERRSASGEASPGEVAWGELVSGDYFDVLGVPPKSGRGFLPEEYRTPEASRVVVISHELWQRRFNADSTIINRVVRLNDHPFTVAGIAPKGFTGTEFAIASDFWVPLQTRSLLEPGNSSLTDRSANWLDVSGRLKPGVTMRQAEAELNIIAGNLARNFPATNDGKQVRVTSELKGRFGNDSYETFRLSGGIALTFVSLVLLVACANVANLLLARATARRKEIGIRLAIGASRMRIVRQLLTESVLLSLFGGALGMLVAYWVTDLMQALVPPMAFRIALDFSPDRSALLWAFGISLITGLVFGLAPAIHATRAELVPVLKNDLSGANTGGKPRRFNLRNMLVVAQVALSLVVLVCGGLFVQSFRNAGRIDPGLKIENRLSVSFDPGLLNYTEEQGKQFAIELIRRVEAVPGVVSATTSYHLPLGASSSTQGQITREGEPPAPPGEGLASLYDVVTPHHFETIGTPLVSGRDFDSRDREGAPAVIIINEEMARRVFGNTSGALGKRLRIGGVEERDAPLLEVVGIARDAKYRSLGENPSPYMYLPQLQRYYKSQMTLLVQIAPGIDTKRLTEHLRREVKAIDARLPVFDVKTMDEHISFVMWGPRLAATLALTFGALALLLAAMGVYSLMSYAVSRRTREIGILMALGARSSDVLRLVLRQGMTLVLLGMTLGLAAAFAATRLLSSLLYGVGASDPVTFAVVTLLLAGVALLACYIPARRATKIDPMVALRFE